MSLHTHLETPLPVTRVHGVAIVLAPLLLLASTLAYITEGNGINDGVLGGTIGVWSSFAFLIAFVGIARLLEHARPKGSATLLVLALTGFAAGVAFNLEAALVAMVPDLDPALDAAFDEGSNAIALLAFLPWGWFVPISFVLAGVMLWRARVAPRWSSWLLVAGGVLFVTSRPARIDVLAAIADVVLVIALVPIGWNVLTSARRPSVAATPTVDVARP